MAAKKPQQNKQREPQRSRTPETKIPPPPTHREDLLPLVAVGSKKFEDLCRSVLKPEFEEIRRVALKRTSGVEQYGVDVEGFDENHDPVVVLSAKCYKTIEAWEFRPWIQDFIDHLDNHWKDSNVKHFILAVTVTANDDDMNKAARGLAKSLGERGIKFHLWDAGYITDLLSSNPQLVDRYFNRHWVEAISAEIASDSPSVNPTAAVSLNNAGGTLALLAAQFQEVYVGPLNSAVSRELDAALAALRRGKRDPIRSWVEANRANVAAWGAIEPAVRAKGLRVLAVIELAEEKGTVAEALLSEADALIEEEDPTARVMFRRVTDGVRAALKELGTPSTRRERELAAGLLIDDDDPRTALDVLSPLAGEDVSSEVMRLRAIATLLVGKGAAAALRLADSALAKEPEGAIARLTRGIIQIAAALVDGVQPGFGGPPTPISRALVRSERTAYEHLEAAQREFQELLAVVDGDLRLELEVWKLAALILNPGKRQEARAYSRYLLSKPAPDPSAVAWCLQHGLPMKRGRIKKTIGDLLRNQRGTPGHVVVLALLAAKMDRPSLAIAVFKKFESQFPEARVFFESWREQFGENAGPPEASYAAAIRYGIETKSYAPLVAFLSSGLSTTEAIIAGSEFLMARKAYTEVLSLRAGLSSIGTARSVEIAAVAAFRLEDFNGSIEILADASRAGLSLPPRLVQLRLRAQEASGDHFNLIKDLKALLRESDDPDLRGRLFDAYVRIGALEDAAQVTKEAIAAGSLDNVNALRVANVLRNFAPETARRAIADIKPDELPKELLPTLLGLSAELGLREVQDEMVRRLFADPSPDGAVTRFDSVEAVIEFMNDRADKYRATIEQWLAGAQPAALTFSGDSKDYALLFLGDRRTRRANMGYSFPMMLAAGTYRSADTLETVGRPGLRMELGALLLADRFRLLDKIEQVFEIYVPPSLPEALVEIRGHFRNVSDAVASHLRAIGRRDSAVQVVTKPGNGARKIQFLHHAPDGDDSRAVFLSVLEHAFQGGHVTKAEKQSARAALGVSDDPLPELTFDSVVISSQALFDLVGLGILEAIARSFSVAVLDTELEQHLKQIDLVEAEGRIGIKVEELRKTVSDRLGSSAWHTLPSRDADFQSMRMQPPAHVRCLIETLPREEAEAPTLFWFEDRTLSRNPPSGAVNLGQMLATLRKSEQLTDDEYFEAMKKLRDAGYSFLPIDADELFAQIRSAPIVSDSVVENDDLSSIRSWFAQDAINLKYIDLTVEIDPSGRVLGESRRTLQLTHLVQDLFALVWSDESATSIEKAARSLWIWTNLRLDCTPSPVGPENPQIRRQFAALNVAQTLALPLHAELGTPEIPKTARQEMVDWLVSVAIEPLAEADPAALELVWDTLAGMLTRLLEPTKERDERIRQALDAHMQRIVAGYLQLLPLEWADQIVSRGSVESVLTRQTVMLLEVGNDQVAVESIAKAFSDAVFSQTNSARFKYYKSGKSALLTLEPDERGIPTGTIKKGRQSGSIDAVTIATLHPDPVIREQIFLSAAEIGSVGRPISQEERVSLAREPDAERRVEILHEFYTADFSRSLSQLDIRIQRKGQLNIDDFDLPDPDVLLNYLGLASDFAGGGIELSANAFKAIKEKMSAREAVWRVSSLPLRVPEEVLPDFAAAVEIPQPGAHRYFMLDMAGAFARARTSGLPEEDLAFLGQVTDERLKFFRKVLIHGAQQALRSDKWSEVNPDLVTYLLWLYADQLVRVLNPSEGSLAQLSAWLSTRSRRRLLDDEEIWGRWTKRCLFNLFPNRLKGAFVAELIELGVAIPPHLVSMVGKPVGSGDWLPNPELFATAPPDAPKECWISADPIPGFARVGWIEETHPFVARDPSRLLRNIMGEVQVENWRVLLPLVALIIDLDDIDADTISALRERVEAYLGLDDAFDPDPARSALLDVLADIYGQQRDREAFNGLLTNVIRLVKSKWPRDVADLHGDAESDRFAIELANATYVFCWAWHSDHSSRVNLFGEILKQAAEAWPGFGPFAIALLENIVVQVDMPTAAAAIWPVLFELRANR